MSSNSPKKSNDPSKHVYGVTPELLEKDPLVAEYYAANFPISEQGQRDDDSSSFASNALFPEEELDGEEPAQEDVMKPRSNEKYPRNIRPLSTFLREGEGSRRGRYLRYHKLIPGLVHGSTIDEKKRIPGSEPPSKIMIQTPWKLLEKELDRYHRNFESRVYDLTIYRDEEDNEGFIERVIPQSVQRHPIQNKIYCANFCRYHPGRAIPLPITYINEEESPALKREAFIIPIQRKIWCTVEDGVDIPESLDLECTGLRLKQVIRLDRLILPDGVRFSKEIEKKRDDTIIGVVQGRARDEADDEAASKK